jgi:GTP-binding protein HflX
VTASVSRTYALILCITPSNRDSVYIETTLNELKELSTTLGYEVCALQTIQVKTIHAATYLGSGQLEKLKDDLSETPTHIVCTNADVSPTQHRNIEKVLGCRLLEWSEIILEIFAQNAKTRIAKTQVEIARLNYALPRLTRQWTHLERQRGGGIALRGMGEKQLELDRRVIRDRLSHLKNDLAHIRSELATQGKGRQTSFKVSLVGYTNAGKSSLLTALTGSPTLIENRLFATLDSKVRALKSAQGAKILISDTVGFIRNLPHALVASFHSTLSEAANADLLAIVVDAADSGFEEKIAATRKVLEEIKAAHIPIVYAFNKIDLLPPESETALFSKYKPLLMCSAKDGLGIAELKNFFLTAYMRTLEERELHIDYKDAALLQELRVLTSVVDVEYNEKGIRVRVKASQPVIKRLCKKWKEKAGPPR